MVMQIIYMIEYDWGIWWKAEPVNQLAMRPKTLNLTAQSIMAHSFVNGVWICTYIIYTHNIYTLYTHTQV